jgi:hypothetical protein
MEWVLGRWGKSFGRRGLACLCVTRSCVTWRVLEMGTHRCMYFQVM